MEVKRVCVLERRASSEEIEGSVARADRSY